MRARNSRLGGGCGVVLAGFSILSILLGTLRISDIFAASSKESSDINRDGRVNILDYTILFENYGRLPLSNPRSDINGDGRVNILDYTILFENFGSLISGPEKTSNGSPPAQTQSPFPSKTSDPAPTHELSSQGRDVLKGLFTSNSWTTPASQIPTDISRSNLVNSFYQNSTATRPGNVNLSINAYTYPVYVANGSTPRRKVVSANPSWSNIHNRIIPFDPSWKPSAGDDAQIVIVDPTTKTYYDLWQVKVPATGDIKVSNGSALENYQNSNGVLSPSRGIGLAYFAMLVTPEEVASGKIEHALSMSGVKNTSSQHVLPGVKSDGETPGGIPMGTRFALTMTDSQIDSWVSSKPSSLRRLARVLGYALRDYGWIITDTGGGAFVQLEDVNSAGALWANLGIVPGTQLSDLLDGLDWANARVLVPR